MHGTFLFVGNVTFVSGKCYSEVFLNRQQGLMPGTIAMRGEHKFYQQYLFVYLFDFCLTPCSQIFHSYYIIGG